MFKLSAPFIGYDSQTLKYRPEIDGLRAVAVIPVIFFHAGVEVFSGGYVGVDVFFVISGYLITKIIINEKLNGNFSLIRFYERRARRILPALFFVIVCCIPFAYMWMLPFELRDFFQSVMSISIFSSNILFWKESGYFAVEAELKPLLHTWSLSVEEQYYLLFPLLVLILWRFGTIYVITAIGAITILSFSISEWATQNHPVANFYLTPTRAWELLVGSICAFLNIYFNIKRNNALCTIGLALITYAIFTYDNGMPYPGIYTLAPVGGAALIILFGDKKCSVGWILSGKLLVGAGLISYSAYLWHQPLFAFARIRSLTEPSELLMLLLAVICFPLAYLTWRYIEQPCRKRSNPILSSRRVLFGASVTTTVALFLLGVCGSSSDEFLARGRNLSVVDADEARLNINRGLHSDCDGAFTLSENCRTSKKPTLLLWGDSFAMHLAQALSSSDTKIEFQQHTSSDCAPIIGISFTNRSFPRTWAEACISFNDYVLDWLKENKDVEYVVLSGAFRLLYNDFVTRNNASQEIGDKSEYVATRLWNTVQKIREIGPKVVLVGPTPSSKKVGDIGRCLKYASYFDYPLERCNFNMRDIDAESRTTLEFLKKFEEDVPTVNLYNLICVNEICDVGRDGVFIFRDNDGHLTKEGSTYLGNKFDFVKLVRDIADRDRILLQLEYDLEREHDGELGN